MIDLGEEVPVGNNPYAVLIEGGAPVDSSGALLEPIGLDLNRVMTPMLVAHTPTPAVGQEVFSTGSDNQDALDISLRRGSRMMAADNTFLGVFRVTGLPTGPAGVPQVAFRVEARDGDLHVTASVAAGTRAGESLEVEWFERPEA